MPYDIPFDRITEVDNKAALTLNKALAAKLIQDFPEVYDLNSSESSGYFLQQEIECLDEEFPDKHFRLYADVNDIGYSFEFWKDAIWLELGASGDLMIRFAQVYSYAIFIKSQGFLISTHSGNHSCNA